MKMPAIKVAPLLLLLLVLAVTQAAGDSLRGPREKKKEAKIVHLSLDVSAGVQKYQSFMNQLQRELTSTTMRPTIENKPVLGVQMYHPECWINVTLHGNGKKSTLAIRADNVYLVGFQTQGGKWYAFKNKENLIAGSTPLNFLDSYNGLTDGGDWHSLKDVVVGKKPAMEALVVLAIYEKGSTTDKQIQEALTRFVLMICEAARFVNVRADVVAVWEQEQGGNVDESALALTVKWRIISCAMLVWGKKKAPNEKEWKKITEATEIKDLGNPKMTSAKETAENIYFILRPTAPCSDEKKTPPRPLLA